MNVSSRISGLYKKPPCERLGAVTSLGLLDAASRAHLEAGGGLALEVADKMSENVLAVHGLPFSIALNFKVNERDVLVPMAVEEPSVVAAASNAARMVRVTGGFFGEADASIMTAQVQLDDVPDAARAATRIEAVRAAIFAAGDASIPRMVERGGGVRDLDVRVLDETLGVVVVHVHVDVGDAMGANMVDSVAEATAPIIHAALGGRVGLRILTNLSIKRLVRVRARVNDADVGGAEIADGIARASRFAELDVFRAVTHNKGFMNGVDAAAVALGQDFRAIEAGVHAFASLSGKYAPISVWKKIEGGLEGRAEIPLAVGIVGGSTSVHVGCQAALQMTRARTAGELAVVMTAAGLASNLAALRALAGEGIQKGHMRLHDRKRAVEEAQIQNGGAR